MTTETGNDFYSFIKELKVQDTFRTYGLVFDTLKSQVRKNLISTTFTEKRSGVRGLCDEGLLEGQNTFYVIGAFLKVLNELGFNIEETVDDATDFSADITSSPLQIP